MIETKTINPAARSRHTSVSAKLKNTDKDEEEQPHVRVTPQKSDVLLGRGRTNFWHAGNVRFRQIIGSHLQTYLIANSRSQKSSVVRLIADEVMIGARCLRQSRVSPYEWYNAGLKAAREKIGHALRDASTDKSRGIKKIHLDLLAKKAEEKRKKMVAKIIGNKMGNIDGLNNSDILVGAVEISRLTGMNVPDEVLSSVRSGLQTPITNRPLVASVGRMYTNPSRIDTPLLAVSPGLAALESAIRLQEANADIASYTTSSESEEEEFLGPSASSASHQQQVVKMYTEEPPPRIKRVKFRRRKYSMKIKSGGREMMVLPIVGVRQQLAACNPVREFSFATKMGMKGNPFQRYICINHASPSKRDVHC